MSDRLSEETLRSVYDAGHQGLPQLGEDDHLAALLPSVDLQALVAAPDAKRLVRAIPAQNLYFSIKERGLSDCLDVLPLLSREQFVRLCDYDAWHEDALVPQALFSWLRFYHEIEPRQMVKRFRQLDEEYQIAALAPYIQIFTEEDYERMSDEEQDRLYSFPREALYYRISSHDEAIHQGIEQLLGAAMGEDMAYAMSLVAHAAYSPPLEAEDQLLQFRRARLEEDGFVSYEESLAYFLPLPFTPELERLRAQSPQAGLVATSPSEGNFLAAVWAYAQEQQQLSADEAANLRQSFLYLANALCAASKLEPDDRDGLKRILGFVRSLISLSLELLADGQREQGLALLKAYYPKRLLQLAFGLFDELRLAYGQLLAYEPRLVEPWKELSKHYTRRKFGACLGSLDRHFLPVLGYERTEVLKGFFNRFPLYPCLPAEAGAAALRMHFTAVSSRRDLAYLLQKLNSLAGEILLANWARQEASVVVGGKGARAELDRVLATALIQTSLSGRFAAQALTADELSQFTSMPAEGVRQSWQNLTTAASERLLAVGSELSAFWQQGLGLIACAGAASSEARLAEHLHAELKALGERLLMARNFGQEALRELVLYSMPVDVVPEAKGSTQAEDAALASRLLAERDANDGGQRPLA